MVLVSANSPCCDDPSHRTERNADYAPYPHSQDCTRSLHQAQAASARENKGGRDFDTHVFWWYTRFGSVFIVASSLFLTCLIMIISFPHGSGAVRCR